MQLATLSMVNLLTQFFNVAPFIYKATPSRYALPDFWTGVFGAPDDSKNATICVTQIIQDYLDQYDELDSHAAVVAQAGSFFWDYALQTLSIHFEHDASPWVSTMQLGKVLGFCDKKIVYIGDIEYSPVLVSMPAISQSQDIINHDKLALVNGTVVLSSVGGELDFLVSEPMYGNDVDLFYLEDEPGVDDYLVTDLIQIASLYVENYSMSQKRLSLKVQDKRKAGNIKVPTETFTVADYPDIADTYQNEIIPLAFGLIRSSKAIPTNGDGTGAVNFRQAQLLTSLGTVQVKINDVWTTKTPTATSLTTGEFTLAEANARSGTSVYECRVLGSVGIDIDNAADVIEYLNERYLSVVFNSANYNLAEWAEAVAALSEIGILIDKQEELHETIRRLQGGSNLAFRYEWDQSGKRTIRLNDWKRAESFSIRSEDIIDADDLGFEVDAGLIAASIAVRYAKDYFEGGYLTERSSAYYDYVKEKYRFVKEMEFPETLLTNSTDAAARALVEAGRYKDELKILKVRVAGASFLGLRIYDVGTIEATAGLVDHDNEIITARRPWLGVWKAQVIGKAPDISKKTNTLTLALIEKMAMVVVEKQTVDHAGTRILSSLSETSTYANEVAYYLGGIYQCATAGTSAWILKNASIPSGELSYYPCDDLPEIPDNLASATYLPTFVTVDGWAAVNAKSVVSVETGALKIVFDGTDPSGAGTYHTKETWSGKNCRIKIRSANPILNVVYYNGSAYVAATYALINQYEAIADFIPTIAAGYANLAIRVNQAAVANTVYFDFIYVGSGLYDTRLPDSSGNGRHLIVYGDTPVPGISGNGILRNGVNNYEKCVAPLSSIPDIIHYEEEYIGTQKATIQSFINYKPNSPTVGFFNLRRQANSDTLLFEYSNGASETSVQFAGYFTGFTSLRCRIAVEINFTAATLKAWRNGVYIGQVALTTPVKPTPGSCIYCGSYQGTSYFAYGIFDERRICPRALTDAEALGLFLIPRGRGSY